MRTYTVINCMKKQIPLPMYFVKQTKEEKPHLLWKDVTQLCTDRLATAGLHRHTTRTASLHRHSTHILAVTFISTILRPY